MNRRPELLAPAGTLKHLRYAYAFGADAVYAGMPRYSLRVRNNSFDLDNLAIGMDEARMLGKQLFVACNLLPHNNKVDTFMADMEPLAALKPDALIMADPGLIMLVRERWPEIPIHLSVQANTVNYAAVNFWKSVGVSRIILSRELSLDEIEDIRQRCPDMELEVFVHGALCIAYSGRCLLSGYFNHRDANQGSCTNACRWDYKVKPAEEDQSGDAVQIYTPESLEERHPQADDLYLIEEKERPGELMPVMEDEHGTYIMNSKDLRAVEYVDRLVEIGVDSLKIEGRTKSVYYTARAAQIYRQAIDDAVEGRPFNPNLVENLDALASRGYTSGFYNRHAHVETQNYHQNRSESATQQYVAEITGHDEASGLTEVLAKNKFGVGDELELIRPSGNIRFKLESMQDMKGNAMDEAPGSDYRVRIPLPADGSEMGMLARYL
ncbi:U32 family peptidase [Solemya pervernicosa gill symbiont]|uniref:U32 family peptidase n=2 Tax=Gammaproteobacteria incertae sedis TaxID=118884 RepID=A0A1T2LB35_9GAMM|nr:tRNA 5-hydroxyuridine modification protein YegQ [Candidatus Reidiella endopervernicosa]OOZ42301.1 U32 family peptidase [Solemya pervernicosa gill symbiont]QKQ25696.1 tRNA 5-hydroxyuridine modification protein YegQ [Candidatus Reidiella endopervernicosa]